MSIGRNGTGGATGRRSGVSANPFMAYNFCVEVGGIVVGGFTSVEGLQSKNEVKTVRQGGVNDTEYRLPGQVTYTDLVLKSGITASDSMWGWYAAALRGEITRQNGSIYLLDPLGSPTVSWNFYNAWPIEWQGPSVDASQTLIATQSFTLAHEGIKRHSAGGTR
ncbi:phage tail protein [Xanthomonas campestris pv. phormiicola]|nr:phage tail protein [Xanthomonas campestris pv. phormiicola]UYC18439.1 phage tail protein [Xanthomonas campestris pv. phormiicola]